MLLVIVVNTKHMLITENFLRPNLNSDPRIGPGGRCGYHCSLATFHFHFHLGFMVSACITSNFV
jgi:hypothetical protein